jgi:hypothetical protein
VRGLLALLGGVLALWSAAAAAHEERLLTGRLEVVEPARRLLVVSEAQGGQRRRLEIDRETEVRVCRSGGDPRLVQPGAFVRVSYIDRVGARPEALSILLLRQP